MNETGQFFIERSRYHFAKDFLPKIERCLELLTDEQIWWRPNPQSNSIGNLVLHLSGNVRQWIVGGIGGAVDARDRDAEFARRELIPKEELLMTLRQTLSEADGTLARMDSEKLLEQKKIQGLDVSALEAILHVVEHFSMHTGQIILLAKMFSEIDLEFYDFSGSTPVLAWQRGAHAK
jgi:uncharacterized damage-inducible protein DinB